MIKYTAWAGGVMLCLLLTACQQNTGPINNTLLPELYQRTEAIQNGKEWEQVQNTYAAACQRLRKKADDPEALLQLTALFVAEARITGEHGHYYPAALRLTKQILDNKAKTDDQHFRALSLRAGVQLSQHTFAEALTTAEKAVRLNPYNAAIYGVLVDAYVELGHYEKAIAMADKMVSMRPDLRSYARVSYLREIHGQVEGAIEGMEMAAAAGYPGQEESCWARLTLGDLYKTYGRLEEARQQYEQALEERENYAFAIAALADLETDSAEAEKMLRRACNIIPEVGFYIQLAKLYRTQGREADALLLLNDIREMLADDVLHGHNMNMEYADFHLVLTKDYKEALGYALAEYERRPQNIDVNRLLGAVYLAMNDPHNARKHLSLASRTASKHPELFRLNRLLASR